MRRGVQPMRRAARLIDYSAASISGRSQPRALRIRLGSVAAAAMVVALSGCASKPEIAIQSYCEIKSTELIDMRDRGLRGLSDANKRAVLAGDDNWKREKCEQEKLGDRSNSGGPR